ncbi:WD40/YVTN/BNR-like repeat-containing protein [Paenibacillus planticolens]|uniref:Exo-alpha-sialidase n=1 Tax=Paenibacillus planticolens TaxID=2654976 RepID=A0ABX1ZXR7_9BACL|nr:hypothetical protein [Paenibacillus planticolens]NOV04839.1 hypothetical protein [Paenibacillus planticolens]
MGMGNKKESKKQLIILTIILVTILVAACDNSMAENTSTKQQTLASMAPEEMVDSVPAPVVVLEGFPMPITSGNRIYFYHEGDLTGWTIDRSMTSNNRETLQVYRTDTRGVNWSFTHLPTEQAWEATVDQDHVFASFHQDGASWVMLQSEPTGNISYKTLYRSQDSGATWTYIGDLTSDINGDVTSIMMLEDGSGFITSSYKEKGVVPFYRTTDGGESWKVQEFPHKRDFQVGIAYPAELGADGIGTVRVDYIKEQGSETVCYETNDNGANWHLFETASILRFHSNQAALDTIKRFADNWLAQDEQKVDELMEEGAPILWIEQMKKHRYTFVRAFQPSNDANQDQLCVGLKYQTDAKDDSAIGTMAVCVRKQPNSSEWRVYMLD